MNSIEQIETQLWEATDQAAGKMPNRPLVKGAFMLKRLGDMLIKPALLLAE